MNDYYGRKLTMPFNGICVMLAEWLAIVNLKNKSQSRNGMYDEINYYVFDMTHATY
jgi:hypothetical protein